jgi:predicted Zn-dependent protease
MALLLLCCASSLVRAEQQALLAQTAPAQVKAAQPMNDRLAPTDEGYPLPLPPEVKVDGHPLTDAQANRSREFAHYADLSFLVETDQYDEARQVLERDSANRSDWPPELALKEVRLLLEQSKVDEARSRCEAVIKSNPESVPAYMLLGEIEAAARNETAVVAALESARKAAPRNRIVLENLGRRYNMRMQKARTTDEVNAVLDRLEDVYGDLVKVVPGRPSAPYLRLLAFIKQKRGRLDEACEYLEALVQVQPREAANFADLAKVLLSLGRKDEAAGILKRGVVVDPANAEILTAVDTVFGDVDPLTDRPKDTKRILEFYATIAQEYPGRDDLQIRYASLLIAADDPDGAITVLEASHAFHPQSREIGQMLALALSHVGALTWEKGDPAAGEKQMRHALELDPGSAETYNTLGYLISETGQRLDAAKAMIEKANALKPGQTHILDSMGWVLYKMGDYENALTYLKQAVAQDTADPTTQEHLGRCYLAAGLKGEGLQCLKAALSMLEKDASPDNAGQRDNVQALIRKVE